MAAYIGVIEHGRVVLPTHAKLKDGTNVIVLPQVDLETEWRTISKTTKIFGLANELVQHWIKSAKVRVHPFDSTLVNAGDVEDASEQLFVHNARNVVCLAAQEIWQEITLAAI